MKRRVVSHEEAALWEMVTQHDHKLDAGRQVEQPMMRIRSGAISPHADMQVFREAMVSAPLMLGGYAGIDRNTADRFRKGALVMDGVVDLHGMSREKAHRVISAFVHDHYARGSRCLLAITGKGVKKGGEGEVQPGILREMLPLWLAEPGLRPLVLACDVAKQKHGGSGAYYILLRRKR